MKKATLCLVAVMLAGAIPTWATTFPLAFKKLTLEEAQSCPGGSGNYGSIQGFRQKPVTNEPKAVSAHPLYGTLYGSVAQQTFRLDESKGDGKGYDRLIIDLNGNKDLTDDLVIARNESAPKSLSSSSERCIFGPVEVPGQKIGPWTPVFYAEMYLYNRLSIKSSQENSYYGQMRMMCGWYLETTIELDGVKQKLAVRDGNCNFKLGEAVEVTKIMRRVGDPGRWYMSDRDYILRDRDNINGGKYTREILEDNAEMFSGILYYGAKPYTLALSPDFTRIDLEPYTGPLGTLTVQKTVSRVVLGHQLSGDKWEAITPEFKDGKAVVPPGTYHLASIGLRAKASDGSIYQTSSSEPKDKTFTVEAGKTVPLEAGLPINLSVAIDKKAGNQSSDSGLMDAARSLFGSRNPGDATTLTMNLSIQGVGGEVYSGFYKSNPQKPGNVDNLAPPRFKILDPAGKQVASGTFEFG
jgi:hypothetical protein